MLDFALLFSLLPAWAWLVFAGCLGAIVGSFVNVYLYRFHTGRSLGGRSHCLSCGTQLRWFELLPIVSYLALCGRCRTCGCRIPPRYFIMEVLTAGLFVIAADLAMDLIAFFWLAAVLLMLLMITVYDYYHFIIPDEFTLVLTGLQVSWLAYLWWNGVVLEMLLWTLAAALAAAVFFGALWTVSGGRWLGFGDVKLAVPLGLWVGVNSVFSFVVLSFWVGAAVSLLVLGYQRYEQWKKGLCLASETLTIKSAIPFAPFMIIGAMLVYICDVNVLYWFSW